MARMTERAKRLVGDAAARGWRYSPTGEELELPARWKWSVGIEHPFRYGSGGTGPTASSPANDLIAGSSRAGRRFWAFWTPYLISGGGSGTGPRPTRCVAFIAAGKPLPTVSATSRRSLARPYMSKLGQWAARRAEKRSGSQADVNPRLDGWPIGSEAFRRHYKVEADDRQHAEWLLGSATQEQLLTDPSISLSTNGVDILAWCDRGVGGDGFDTATVDALLEVLDTVELP
jgi:hypothetical protein